MDSMPWMQNVAAAAVLRAVAVRTGNTASLFAFTLSLHLAFCCVFCFILWLSLFPFLRSDCAAMPWFLIRASGCSQGQICSSSHPGILSVKLYFWWIYFPFIFFFCRAKYGKQLSTSRNSGESTFPLLIFLSVHMDFSFRVKGRCTLPAQLYNTPLVAFLPWTHNEIT